MKKIFITLLMLIGLMTPVISRAEDGYVINSKASKITCMVKYTLIGKYAPSFEDFSGLIYFDPKDISKSSVYLRITTDSIQSKYATLDRLAKSTRLLDSRKYPDVIFQSKKIEKRTDGYYVSGLLTLHGVTKNFTFPFKMEGPVVQGKKSFIIAQGKWLIDRKKFNVFWDKHLDHGGIIVGDQITVDWKIKAEK
jgi:polyisoprenoid-binding protein YceI